MEKTIFLVVVNNSPELQNDCPACEIVGAFYNHRDAAEVLKLKVESEKEDGFLPVDTAEDYVVSYKDGNENSILWCEYRIESVTLK